MVRACLKNGSYAQHTHTRTHTQRKRKDWKLVRTHTDWQTSLESLISDRASTLGASNKTTPFARTKEERTSSGSKKQRYMKRDLLGNWFCHYTLLTAGPRVRRRWGWRRACPWRRRPSTPPPCRGCTSAQGGSPCRSGRDKIHIRYLRFPKKICLRYIGVAPQSGT